MYPPYYYVDPYAAAAAGYFPVNAGYYPMNVGADPFADYAAAAAGAEDYAPLFDPAAAAGYDGLPEIGAGETYYEVGADGQVYGPFVMPAEVGAPINLQAAANLAARYGGRLRYPGGPAPAPRGLPVPRRAPAPAPARVRVPARAAPSPADRRAFWDAQERRAEEARLRYGKRAVRVLGLVATSDTLGGGGTGTASSTPAISGPVVAILAPKAVAEDYVFSSLSVGIQPVSANGGTFSAISFSPDLNRNDIDPFDGMAVIAGTPVSASFINFGTAASRFRVNVHVLDETSGPMAIPRP